MKRLMTLLGVAILVGVLFQSCYTSQKALDTGDYYRAVMSSVERLRSSPNHKKSQEVLAVAYPLAQNHNLRAIDNLLASNSANKYARILDEYQELQNMAEAIYRSPKALEIIPNPKNYSSEISKLISMAAEEAYELGMYQFQQNTMQSAREAYHSFMKADSYISGYKDVRDRIDEALYHATFKVIVQKPIIPPRYQVSADFFYDNLMVAISKMDRNQFVKFYTYEEAQYEMLEQPDQYLVLNFENFSVGNLRESKNSFDLKRDSVLVGSTYIDGVKHDVFGDVKATVIQYKREVISEGVLSAQFVQASNGRIVEYKNFPGSYVWVNEWASFRGDERALDSKHKRMISVEPSLPPPHQDLFVEFTKPIYNQVVSFVNTYYRRYDK